MCALMGSSGAGKTTLMDVIAMRKTSGTIQGEVRLNGYLQDEDIFRRCSGYVEQFDVQTPQLTIRETVLFSARLRLDERKVNSDAEKVDFCDHVLKTLELTAISDRLVGSDEEGGMSFEQRKRLSIAVELAASPSILFLDEVRCRMAYFIFVSNMYLPGSMVFYAFSQRLDLTLEVRCW
jgi:ABC-type multidrug transport system ATPase subunit